MNHVSTNNEDETRAERGKRYATVNRRLFFIGAGLSAAYLLLVAAIDGLAWAALLAWPAWVAAPVAALALGFVYAVLTFPLSVYGGYVRPRRFGLLIQSFPGWIFDRVKANAIAAVLLVGLVAALYALLLWSPQFWWLGLAAVVLLLTVILAQLAPVLLIPLFYKLTPLEDEELKRRLNELAGRTGTRIKGFYEMKLSDKTTMANAALAGIGRTRRVILGDTLRDRYSHDEIEAILAHELGHQVHRDIPKQIAFQTALILVGLWLVSLVFDGAAARFGVFDVADPRSLPVLALLLGVYMTVTTPLSNWFTRISERSADRFALETTKSPAHFISMMRKLASQNLSEPEPSPLVEAYFYSHPHPAKRIRFAEGWSSGS